MSKKLDDELTALLVKLQANCKAIQGNLAKLSDGAKAELADIVQEALTDIEPSKEG